MKDLHFGQVAEAEVLRQIAENTKLNPESINDKTCDIKIELSYEIKRDAMAKRTGNIAIEMEYKGKPSGIYATKAGVVVYAIEGTYWWCYTDDLKTWLENNENKYEIKYGGDGAKSKLALIKAFDFFNEIANKISIND